MSWRRHGIVVIIVAIFLVIFYRLYGLYFEQRDFLHAQGDARVIRKEPIVAKRGYITDRNGVPLAITTPVSAVVINPKVIDTTDSNWPKVLKLLHLDMVNMTTRLSDNRKRGFMYLKRQLPPHLAKEVADLKVPGVFIVPEYKRYYPDAEVSAQVLGLVNIDNKGQEGVEMAYNHYLQGQDGSKVVLKDRKGHIIEVSGEVKPVRHGQPIALSLDRRLQHITYMALKRAVQKNKALAGSAVILDAKTGEILAMANQPSFNPNARSTIQAGSTRNRAITDVFEPGSVIKPFAVTAALDSGLFSHDDLIDVHPGKIKVGDRWVQDVRNYGQLDVSGIIQKSSNVGISKLVLALPPEYLPQKLQDFGFSQAPGTGFPGEQSGTVVVPRADQEFVLATLAFGYGMSASTLQLAQAYAVFANKGLMQAPNIIRQQTLSSGRRVLNPTVAKQVLTMLEKVVQVGGTGVRASVPGYRVAGKTGTARKASVGGYSVDSYTAIFAGIIPASNPRLVMVVMIDDPRGELYYGGSVAAPVFKEVMTKAMRILGVEPDAGTLVVT